MEVRVKTNNKPQKDIDIENEPRHTKRTAEKIQASIL